MRFIQPRLASAYTHARKRRGREVLSIVCSLYLIVSDAPAPGNAPILLDSHRSCVCKIGISVNPGSRLAELQTASPFHLAIDREWKIGSRAHAQAAERCAHESASQFRMAGEWFYADVGIIRFIIDDALCLSAIDSWGFSLGSAREWFLANGYPPDHVDDIIASNYGGLAA